jgi:adenylate cyclase class IV
MIKHREIEYKYKSDNIKLKDFVDLINSSVLKVRWQEVSSYDDYAVNDSGKFVRYRYNNENGQLTTKEKTSDINNQDRVEYNLNLHNNSLDTVKGFFESLGFHHNFRIYKVCHIAWISDKLNAVYYVVMDENLEELNRFIELESSETYEWKSEQEALEELLKYEKLLEPLGISPQNRLRKSLFELYRK